MQALTVATKNIMEIQEVDKKQMEALQFLADTNLKIGDARTLLIKLQEQETTYLDGREQKALDRIQAVLDRSQQLLIESAGNYEKVKELYDTVCAFADLLAKAYDDFVAFKEKTEEKNQLQEERLTTIEEQLSHREQDVKAISVKIENEKKGLAAREKALGEAARKVISDRSAVDNKIKRLKEGRI